MIISGLEMSRTKDGGKTWDTIPLSSGQALYSFAFADRKKGWAVGTGPEDKPLIMETADLGSTWHSVSFEQDTASQLKATGFTDICLTAGQLWLLSKNYTTAPSRDSSGSTVWSRRRLGNDAIVRAIINDQTIRIANVFYVADNLRSISCTSNGEVWAVGDRSAVFHYENGWKREASGINNKYTFMRAISIGKDVWLMGGDWTETESVASGFPRPGILLKSRDNGQTWDDQTPPSASLLSDLSLTNGKGWLIGAQGSIYFSDDNGNTWTKTTGPTQTNLSQIFFRDPENVWIVGERSTVLRLSR
jgi:photosystem II stability/assembly factor-like uncharacterized protein